MSCCNAPAISTEDFLKVCTNCGFLYTENDYVIDNQFDSNGRLEGVIMNTTDAYQGESSLDKYRILMDDYCHSLKCEQLKDRIYSLFRETCSKIAPTKKLNLVLLGCIYIAVKDNGYPYTLHYIARVCGVDVFALGEMYKHTRTILGVRSIMYDPEEFLPLYCQKFTNNESEYSELLERSCQIMNLGKTCWLEQGRRVDSYAASAVITAYLAKRKKRPTESIYQKAAEVSMSAPASIQRRHSEMVAMIFEKSKLFPWFSDLKRSTIYPFIFDILDALQQERIDSISNTTRSNPSSSRSGSQSPISSASTLGSDKNWISQFQPPPSYIKNSNKRLLIDEKITKAEKRIKSEKSFSENELIFEEADVNDHVIESLLCKGYSKEDVHNVQLKKHVDDESLLIFDL